jgi:hypothetical protein
MTPLLVYCVLELQYHGVVLTPSTKQAKHVSGETSQSEAGIEDDVICDCYESGVFVN